MREYLIYLSLKYQGDAHKMFKELKSDNKDYDESILEEVHHDVITAADDNYPDRFKKVKNPPLVLYYKGNLDLMDRDYYLKEYTFNDYSRCFLGCVPMIDEDVLKLDYVVGCEKQEDLEKMIDYINKDLIKFKDYE